MGSLALIAALPLLGFLVNGLFGSRLPRRVVALIGCALPALAFAITVALFMRLAPGAPAIAERLYSWVLLASFKVDIALYFDAMTAVMCLVVTGIGTLIHVYSVGYMAHDKSFARYFAYLNLFLFFMLLLVLGGNLLVLFVGWEGVGLASYLLIGFWFEDPEKTAAGIKAFVVNRVGDAGFVVAAFLIYIHAGSFDFQAINAYFSTPTPPPAVTTTIGLLLLLGACGKSAQIPLHVWLPDAMAGPTPVSALIHAATMVTAGVYLLARLNGLYVHTPEAMAVVAWIGAATALLGATMGVTQFNLKKVLAYSTISQIGFMVMACGVGAFSVGTVPPHDARLLQGVPLPGRRRRPARAAGRGRHAQHGRPRAKAPVHVRHVPGGNAGAVRNPAVRRLLLEGRDPLAGLVGAGRLALAVASSAWRPPGSPPSTCSARSTSRSSARVVSRNGFGPACTSRRPRCRACSPCSPSARSAPGSSECPASCASSSASRRRSTAFSRRCFPPRLPSITLRAPSSR